MITDFLTQDEREKGARMLIRHSFFNGLGFGFLAETIIYLLALQFNPTNTQLGYISSAVHIAGLSLLVLPRMTHGINLRKLYFAAWMARGSVGVFYMLLLFLKGQPAVVLILGVYSLFCVSRIVGVSMAEPVQQMLATSESRGQLVTRNFISNQAARLLSQLLSFALTSVVFFSELGNLLFLIGIGIVANTVSALFLLGIPYREKNRYSRKSSLPTVFLRVVRDRDQIVVILVRCLSLMVAVLIGFAIPFLRVVLALPQNLVFLYSVVGTGGMILSGLFLRPFVDSVGSKPLLLSAFVGQAATLASWALLGRSIPYGVVLILGLGTTFLQASVFQLVARLVINAIPGRDKISFMSLLNFITALFAFGAGVLGGLLIDLGESLPLPFGSAYSYAFAAGSVISIAAFLLVLTVRERGSLKVRETASILFSLRNLKTFLDIYNFHLTDDPVRKQTILTSINYSPAPQAEPELRQILNNPIAPDKDQILISLYKNPRPRLLDLIIREAENSDSPHRGNAIFALGAYPGNDTQEALYRLFACDDPRIFCAAAKSLARIESSPPVGQLEEILLRPALPTRAMEDLMVALSVGGNEAVYLKRLFALAPVERGRYHEQAILSLAARLEGFTPPLDEIYARENGEPGSGLGIILEEARSFEPFFHAMDRLYRLFSDGDFPALREWCRTVAAELSLAEYTLAAPILEESTRAESTSSALARLYFLFQLLNRKQAGEQ